MDATAIAAASKWAFEQLTASFASVFEAMTGSRPEVAFESLPGAPATAGEFGWKQPLPPLPGFAFAAASDADAVAAGQAVMVAAGVEDCSPDELKSTYLETLGQAFSILARAITSRLGREVTPKDGARSTDAPANARWAAIRIKLGEQSITIHAALPEDLLAQLVTEPKAAAAAAQGASSNAVATAAPPAPSPAATSKTFDLLLEVELPVSVSFGHAQVPLRDVLTLNTGSIVELNRAVVEPVDIIVNNCVIAKGEVVVVEGNFGVRIQHVVSKHERLRSIQ